MDIQIMAKVLAGAGAGAMVGFLLGRARLCAGGICNVKLRLVFNIIGGAVFGAAVAWWLINR